MPKVKYCNRVKEENNETKKPKKSMRMRRPSERPETRGRKKGCKRPEGAGRKKGQKCSEERKAQGGLGRPKLKDSVREQLKLERQIEKKIERKLQKEEKNKEKRIKDFENKIKSLHDFPTKFKKRKISENPRKPQYFDYTDVEYTDRVLGKFMFSDNIKFHRSLTKKGDLLVGYVLLLLAQNRFNNSNFLGVADVTALYAMENSISQSTLDNYKKYLKTIGVLKSTEMKKIIHNDLPFSEMVYYNLDEDWAVNFVKDKVEILNGKNIDLALKDFMYELIKFNVNNREIYKILELCKLKNSERFSELAKKYIKKFYGEKTVRDSLIRETKKEFNRLLQFNEYSLINTKEQLMVKKINEVQGDIYRYINNGNIRLFSKFALDKNPKSPLSQRLYRIENDLGFRAVERDVNGEHIRIALYLTKGQLVPTNEDIYKILFDKVKENFEEFKNVEWNEKVRKYFKLTTNTLINMSNGAIHFKRHQSQKLLALIENRLKLFRKNKKLNKDIFELTEDDVNLLFKKQILNSYEKDKIFYNKQDFLTEDDYTIAYDLVNCLNIFKMTYDRYLEIHSIELERFLQLSKYKLERNYIMFMAGCIQARVLYDFVIKRKINATNVYDGFYIDEKSNVTKEDFDKIYEKHMIETIDEYRDTDACKMATTYIRDRKDYEFVKKYKRLHRIDLVFEESPIKTLEKVLAHNNDLENNLESIYDYANTLTAKLKIFDNILNRDEYYINQLKEVYHCNDLQSMDDGIVYIKTKYFYN